MDSNLMQFAERLAAVIDEQVQKSLAKAMAVEREACALIAQECEIDNHGAISQHIAAKIRARGGA